MRRSILSLLVVVIFSALSLAQASGKAQLSYKLLSIHVRGLNRYQQDQIVRASGLKIGQLAREEDFKRAIEKLGDSGVFLDVAYSYEYSTAGCNLEFRIVENDKLAPIVFDNFVWFSDAQLLDMLRSRVPLFMGQLPLAGKLSDEVSEALNGILSEKKIPGEVGYLPHAPRENKDIDSYVYKVNLHPVVIRNIEFPGASPDELPALQTAAKSLAGQAYLRTEMGDHARLDFMPVYLAHGYLKASFANAEVKVAEDGARTLVDVTFRVTPGIQYKLTGIDWAGNAVFSSNQLQNLIHVKTGDPVNAVQLEQDIGVVKKLYGTKGYLAAQVHPEPAMDDAQAIVRYRLNVSEGDLYRMGALQIDGVPQDAANRMITQWQMKKGDPFDSSYASRFFKLMYRDVSLSRSFNVAQKQNVDPATKTVSVFLHFVPK